MAIGMDDPITSGRIKSKTPREIIKKDKRKIFTLIKNGFTFDDEVLEAAGIRRSVSNERVYNSVCEHAVDTKRLPKDKLSLNKIIEELSTVEKEKVKANED